jgi:hypothetical protein
MYTLAGFLTDFFQGPAWNHPEAEYRFADQPFQSSPDA